ncbi:MAG: histidinol-phosphate transaminase [Clostridia bacterium]|nr:histidinol-phosphate transaminase [Clostridia bacterium]
MSKFFSEKYSSLTPYTPGEQPKDAQYIKLNTNESPFPPTEKAVSCAAEAAERLNLYPDPECFLLTSRLADILGVDREEVLLTNGSDEILNFAFMAYCDDAHPAAFADITYGFYKVFAELNRVPYEIIPLSDDLTIRSDDYIGINKTIFIANPNAPTGIALTLSEIERIVESNPDNIVVIDEAYVDFGGESAVPLIKKYDNLLVTQTFSKSRSMAGARLGFGVGCKELIRDLNTVKYSTNPYNINMMTMAAGIGILEDEETVRERCKTICENRTYTADALTTLGFECIPSSTNFIFARHPHLDGETVYLKLKEAGILVRHFTTERIKDYNRITIGTREQMEALVTAMIGILGELLYK